MTTLVQQKNHAILFSIAALCGESLSGQMSYYIRTDANTQFDLRRQTLGTLGNVERRPFIPQA